MPPILRIDPTHTFHAVNMCTLQTHSHESAFVLAAADEALPAALEAYQAECRRLEVSVRHLAYIRCLYDRVLTYRRNPDQVLPIDCKHTFFALDNTTRAHHTHRTAIVFEAADRAVIPMLEVYADVSRRSGFLKNHLTARHVLAQVREYQQIHGAVLPVTPEIAECQSELRAA